ncbi:MAG: hypothetical protein HY720_03790 [Planctomycetes bacterium]|nr:hypothetical protein [Planctomycetota bacterium]
MIASPTRAPNSKRAAALIVTIAILSVLAVLALTLARVTWMEAGAAGHEVQAARARMAADAGVEFGVERLRAWLAVQGFLGPTDPWYYPPRRAGDYAPLESSARTSFASFPGGPAGFLPPAPDGSVASFRLKILDASGMLWIGGLDPREISWLKPEDEARRRKEVGRLLNTLCDLLLGREYRGLGTRILAAQPARGWHDKRELSTWLAKEGYEEEVFARLADHVTLSPGWLDRDLARFLAPPYPAAYEPWARAPVNANTASPYVLAALFEGVSGIHRVARRDGPGSFKYEAEAIPPIDRSTAIRIAQKLVATREIAPLQTWEDFRYFLLAMVQCREISSEQAGALGANFNPNSDGNWFNHDATLHREICKADVFRFDLARGSTEFVFHPTGVFEIESQGEVTRPSGEILARARSWASVRIFEVAHQTTQAQFEANYQGGSGTSPAPAAIRATADSIRSEDNVANFDGQVVLAGIEDSSAPGNAIFKAPCLGTLAPWRSRVSGNDPRGYLGTATEDVRQADTAKGVAAIANLHYDGVFFDYARMNTLIYPTQADAQPLDTLSGVNANLPPREGRIEFWFKLDDWSTALESWPLVLATNPDSPYSGLQTKIYWRDGQMIASRYYFVRLRGQLAGARYNVSEDGQSVRAGAEIKAALSGGGEVPPELAPDDMVNRFSRVDLPIQPEPHRWYHVSLSYQDYVTIDLEVDGRTAHADGQPGPEAGLASVLPHIYPDVYFGPVYFDVDGRFRSPGTAGPTAVPNLRHAVWTLTNPPRYTLAGLVIRDAASDPASVPVPSRYPVGGPGRSTPPATYIGTVPLPEGAIPVSLSWTEYETASTFLDVYYACGGKFMPALDPDGRPVPVPGFLPAPAGAPNDFHYLVQVSDEGPGSLVATPVLDDVTVLYLTRVQYLAYQSGERPVASVPPLTAEESPFAGPVKYVGTWFVPQPRAVRGGQTAAGQPAGGSTSTQPQTGADRLGRDPTQAGNPAVPQGPSRVPQQPPPLVPPPGGPMRSGQPPGGPPPPWNPNQPPMRVINITGDQVTYEMGGQVYTTRATPVVTNPGSPDPGAWATRGGSNDPGGASTPREKPGPNMVTVPPGGGGSSEPGLYQAGD